MYQKYSTDALVLGSNAIGEADKLFVLYTRDFGLVHARASAVRREASRMRYALQNYSRAQVSLVRGARGWRVAGALALSGVQGADRNGIAVFARVARLVGRLVVGEEKNDYLFSVLSEAHRSLLTPVCVAHTTIELISVARILFGLGYLSSEALGTALLTHTAYAGEHLAEAEQVRDKLLASVNRAISETHL